MSFFIKLIFRAGFWWLLAVGGPPMMHRAPSFTVLSLLFMSVGTCDYCRHLLFFLVSKYVSQDQSLSDCSCPLSPQLVEANGLVAVVYIRQEADMSTKHARGPYFTNSLNVPPGEMMHLTMSVSHIKHLHLGKFACTFVRRKNEARHKKAAVWKAEFWWINSTGHQRHHTDCATIQCEAGA